MKGPNKFRGSWIYPDLAIYLAQWISPQYSFQLSGWIREQILINTKTDKELKCLEEELFEARKIVEIKEQGLQREYEARERAERELEELKRRELKLQEFIKCTAKLESKEVIYIGTSKAYQRQNRFKVGGCSSSEALISRFSNYNCGRPSDDRFFCVRFWLVHSYSVIEKMAKTLLVNYRDDRSKAGEVYHIHGSALMTALDSIVQNSNTSVEWFNEHFRDFTEQTINEAPSAFEPIQLR